MKATFNHDTLFRNQQFKLLQFFDFSWIFFFLCVIWKNKIPEMSWNKKKKRLACLWLCRKQKRDKEMVGWGVRAECLQEDDERRRVHVGTKLPSITPESWPPNGGGTNPTTSTTPATSIPLVNEQAARPAELAGKPPPEGTKVFVMELLKFGGLADIT